MSETIDSNIESNIDLFAKRLNELKSDSEMSRNDLRTIIESLIKIYKNLKINRDNERVRRINTNSNRFHCEVWRHSAAKELLLSGGWDETIGGHIVFDDKRIDVSKCIDLLIANRDIKPNSNDWINSEQKYENPVKVREELLRESAEKERICELEEYKRNQRETKLLAENVKKEIESDVRHRKRMAELSSTSDESSLSVDFSAQSTQSDDKSNE